MKMKPDAFVSQEYSGYDMTTQDLFDLSNEKRFEYLQLVDRITLFALILKS